MKKTVLSLLILLSLLCHVFLLTSCTPADETAQTTGILETEATAGEQTTAEEEEIPDEPGGEAIQYNFATIRDLHTFVTTGSTDPADYDEITYTITNDADWLPGSVRSWGYRSFSLCFDADENDFNHVECGFLFPEELDVLSFTYFLDDVMVLMMYAAHLDYDGDPTVLDVYFECWKPSYVPRMSESDLLPYDAAGEVTDGIMFRPYGDNYVLYEYMDKKLYSFACYEQGFMIMVAGTLLNLSEDLAVIFQDEKYAPFAAFFSEDDAIFEAAMERLIAGLAVGY